MIQERVQGIVEDHRSGATTLGLRTLRITQAIAGREDLSARDRQSLTRQLFKDVITAHPQMGILRYLQDVMLHPEEEDQPGVRDLRRNIIRHREDNAKAFARHCKRKCSILTISYSSAVQAALMAARKKRINVIVPESRPKNEGRSLASELAKNGINTTLIVDAAMGLHIENVDYVLLGCDSITRERFVNKIGSLPVALLAKQAGKPVYVFVDPYRIVQDERGLRRQQQHLPAEVTRADHEYEIDNRYFDFIPNTLITHCVYRGKLQEPSKLFSS